MNNCKSVCDKAIKIVDERDKLQQLQRERRAFMSRGICPDCGDDMHKEDHYRANIFNLFLRNDYYIYSCSKCNISERFEYAVGP